jgi:alpha-1,2-mannosyltransferase
MTLARTVLAATCVAVMVAVTGAVVAVFGYLTPSSRPHFLVASAILWVLFAATVVLIRRIPVKSAVILIIAGSVALGGAAMLGPPDTSTDAARYAWDGIVQDAGFSPYRYVPNDDALAKLRPDWLFDAPEGAAPEPRCGAQRYLTKSSPSGAALCTAINRPSVPTIYPPASELLFAAVRSVVAPTARYWPFQLVGLLIALGITVLLLLGLKRRGLDPRWAALWALCPLTISEAVTNSHVDILGSLLTLIAIFAIARGARWRGGILLGAAIAAKLIPILAAPAILRREPWKIVLAAVTTFAVLYVPYVLTTGLAVIGYLPGYLSEEGYDSGNRFVLLRAFLPPAAALIVAAVLILAVVIVTIILSNPERPWLGQLVVIGAALVIASPPYAWYALLLIPFVAMSGRWEWLAIPAALSVHELITSTTVFRWALLASVVIIVAAWLVRGAMPQWPGRLSEPVAS